MHHFIWLVLFMGTSSFAHTHDLSLLESQDDLSSRRLIDLADGSKPKWMSFGQAMKLSEKAHAEGRCGGFMDVTDAPSMPESAMPLVEWFKADLPNRLMKQQAFLSQSLGRLNEQEIFNTVRELSSFRNRYYKSPHGVKAAEYIANRFKAIAGSRSGVQINLFRHPKWPQPSVIATIPGQGPRSKEIVIIGGHEDSINKLGFGSSNMSAPGADDNATGVATVLEVFRELVQSGFRPDRTLMFITYAAEEVGLRGSQEIANSFKASGRSVVAVMQLDMTSFAGIGNQIVFMTDFTNPSLTQFTQQLVDTYVKVKWTTDVCKYACSDHASWTKAGYAAVMPFESTMKMDNKSIHSANDVMQKLDFKHGLSFARLGLAFMVELSK